MRGFGIAALAALAPSIAYAQDAGLAYDPEVELDARIGVVDPNHNFAPAVAYGGGQFLTVWGDGRDAFEDMFGARVSVTGQVIDRDGIGIEVVDDRLANARASFDGTNFFVAWRNTSAREAVQLKRVTPQGAVLPPVITVGTVIFAGGHNLACSVGQCLVVWSQADGIYAARVDSSATLVDATPLRLSSTPRPRVPTVASDGSDYVVTWNESEGGAAPVMTRAVSRTGQLGTLQNLSGTQDGHRPRIAFGTGQYLVIWGDNVSLSRAFSGVRVGADGRPIDSAPIAVRAAGTALAEAPTVTFVAGQFLVSFIENARTPPSSTLLAIRVATNGQVIDAPPITLDQSAWRRHGPQVASDGTTALLVWDDFRSEDTSNHDIFATRIDSTPTALDGSGFVVALSPNDQADPDVTSGANQYLVAWADLRQGHRFGAYATRVSLAGQPSGPAFAIAASADEQTNVRVASDGQGYFAVWQQAAPPHVRGARIDASGQVLDPGGVQLSPAGMSAGEPNIGFGGGQYLIAFTHFNTLIADEDNILGMRVRPDGAQLDPTPLRISAGPRDQRSPCVTSDGIGFLVTWEDRRHASRQIYAARVDAAGNILDTDGIHLSTPNTRDIEVRPSATFAAGHFLVAWNRHSAPGSTEARRVSPTGVLVDPRATVLDGLNGLPAAVAAFGGYLVAWPSRDFAVTREIRLSTVSATVTAASLPPIPGSVRKVAIAMHSDQQGLLVYDSEEVPGGHRIGRVRARVIRSCQGADCDPPDAGPTDSGVFSDADVVDAGMTDSGFADAGVVDSALSDSSINDAERPDTEQRDVGSHDAGTHPDAAATDSATASIDTGGQPRARDADCACDAGATGSDVDIYAIVLLAMLIGRRRHPTVTGLGRTGSRRS